MRTAKVFDTPGASVTEDESTAGTGPAVFKAFAAIEPPARQALEADLLALLGEFNLARDGTLVVPSEYLEVVVT